MSPRDDFADIARRWGPFFRTHLRIGLAFRDSSGAFHLRYCLNGFSPEVSRAFNPLVLQTRSIRATRVVTELDPQTASAAVEHTLGDPSAFKFSDGTTASLTTNFHSITYAYERFFPARMAGPTRTPALVVTANQAPIFPSVDELNQELLACPTPFDGLLDLVADLAVPIELATLMTRATAEIILFPPASLTFAPVPTDGTHLAAGKLSLLISAHQDLDLTKLRIGLKQFPADAPVTVRTSASTAEDLIWEDVGPFKMARYEQAAPVPLCLAILSHGDDFVGRWWVRDPGLSYNARAQIHRAVDPNRTFVSTFFNERNDFEDRVSLLLLLLGLLPFKYGRIAQLTDAPDILASSVQGHVYVIDCTTGDIDRKGKLHRLYDRANRIRETLFKSPQPPVAVLPMIVTSLSRQETAIHLPTAAAFKIAVVSREDLTNLFDQLEAPPTPEQLYAAALSTIPAGRTASEETAV